MFENNKPYRFKLSSNSLRTYHYSRLLKQYSTVQCSTQHYSFSYLAPISSGRSSQKSAARTMVTLLRTWDKTCTHSVLGMKDLTIWPYQPIGEKVWWYLTNHMSWKSQLAQSSALRPDLPARGSFNQWEGDKCDNWPIRSPEMVSWIIPASWRQHWAWQRQAELRRTVSQCQAGHEKNQAAAQDSTWHDLYESLRRGMET